VTASVHFRPPMPYRLGNRYAVPALSDEADFASSSSGGDLGDADVTDGRYGARVLRCLHGISLLWARGR